MIWLLWQHFFLIRNYIQLLCMNMELPEQLFGHVHVWRIQEKLAGKGELHTGYSTWESWVPTSSFFLSFFFWGGVGVFLLFCIVHFCTSVICTLPLACCSKNATKLRLLQKFPCEDGAHILYLVNFLFWFYYVWGKPGCCVWISFWLISFFFLKLVLQIFLSIFRLKT